MSTLVGGPRHAATRALARDEHPLWGLRGQSPPTQGSPEGTGGGPFWAGGGGGGSAPPAIPEAERPGAAGAAALPVPTGARRTFM